MEDKTVAPAAPRRFHGWIPCLTGRLSFDEFGNTEHPSRAVHASSGHGLERVCACFQRRELFDGEMPRFMVRQSRLIIDLVFAAVARSAMVEGEEVLRGYCYVFQFDQSLRDESDGSTHFWRRNIRNVFNNSQQTGIIHEIRHLQPDFRESWWNSFEDNTHDELKQNAAFFVSFSIQRNGHLTLEIDPQWQSQIVSLHNESETQGSRFADHFYLASQIYIFLKDTLHNHQHHAEADDQTALLYEEDSAGKSVWIADTARLLFKYVIVCKRRRALSYCRSSLGVLAYLASFLRSFGEKIGVDEKFHAKEGSPLAGLHGFSELENSVRAKMDTLQAKQDLRFKWVSHLWAPFFSALAVLMATAALYRFSLPVNTPLPLHSHVINIGAFFTKFPYVALPAF